MATEEIRTLTPGELNRALLARQQLLERADLSIPLTLERMGTLQAQYAPSMYVGLWSRVEGFTRDQLTRLLKQREVVQGTLMRITIHLVSRRDYWPLAMATRAARRAWWLRVQKAQTVEDVEAAAARLRVRLQDGPINRRELDALVGRELSIGVGLWIDMVRAPPSGTWERRRADIYASSEQWLGPPPAATPEAGIEYAIRRYLGGFGPSARGEIASWLGLPITHLALVLDGMPLRRFRAEDGADLLDLPDAPLPHPDTPAPVRFLPEWDAILLVHARRKQVLLEEHRPLVFNPRTPHSVATFLVDGVVAGAWKYREGRIDITPYRSLSSSEEQEVSEEADRLLDLYL